jgi:hypothetical protein
MEQDRNPDIEYCLANYDAIVRRAREERSRAIAEMLGGLWPFLGRVGGGLISFLASAVRGSHGRGEVARDV